jgi:hypothetical protein
LLEGVLEEVGLEAQIVQTGKRQISVKTDESGCYDKTGCWKLKIISNGCLRKDELKERQRK